jgi:hypothetical protein
MGGGAGLMAIRGNALVVAVHASASSGVARGRGQLPVYFDLKK